MVEMNLPAVCERCGRPFPSGIVVDKVSGLTMSGNTSGPCPYCGGLGLIPDGVFDVMDGTIRLVAELSTTRRDLLAAARIFTEAVRDGSVDVDVLTIKLQREAPTALPLLQILRDPATASMLAILAIIVSVILSMRGPDGSSVPDVDIHLDPGGVCQPDDPQRPPKVDRGLAGH